MASAIKNQKDILQKLGIEKLNSMQEEAQFAIHSNNEVILISPTGTGKTLAFSLPIISELDSSISEIQILIIVPSRELAIQIEQVIREMGTGFKVNAVYGGRSGTKDRVEIKHRPAILVGTPGRVADHIRRDHFSTEFIWTLVLDEFDKSLEVGFEKEMMEIVAALPKVKKKILTSATNSVDIPAFVQLNKPITIDYSTDTLPLLEMINVESASKDKLQSLVKLLKHLGNQPGIIFCNFKDSIQRVSDYLTHHHIDHGCFYGGMEQQDRERALIKFRNGTHQIIVATDLAARGIDILELKFIIHYHLPIKEHEFVHRNGRTARMHSSGTAYILHWNHEKLPDFIEKLNNRVIDEENLEDVLDTLKSEWSTVFISGGRKDKISKGDIAGLCFKQGELNASQLGKIELKQDCAFVAVSKPESEALIERINNTKLKKKKVRVSII